MKAKSATYRLIKHINGVDNLGGMPIYGTARQLLAVLGDADSAAFKHYVKKLEYNTAQGWANFAAGEEVNGQLYQLEYWK